MHIDLYTNFKQHGRRHWTDPRSPGRAGCLPSDGPWSRAPTGRQAQVGRAGDPIGRLTHPARIVPLAFLMAIWSAPYFSRCRSQRPARPGHRCRSRFHERLGGLLTGPTTVDTATYWSPFGQVVILALIQIGGFGIMTAR